MSLLKKFKRLAWSCVALPQATNCTVPCKGLLQSCSFLLSKLAYIGVNKTVRNCKTISFLILVLSSTPTFASGLKIDRRPSEVSTSQRIATSQQGPSSSFAQPSEVPAAPPEPNAPSEQQPNNLEPLLPQEEAPAPYQPLEPEVIESVPPPTSAPEPKSDNQLRQNPPPSQGYSDSSGSGQSSSSGLGGFLLLALMGFIYYLYLWYTSKCPNCGKSFTNAVIDKTFLGTDIRYTYDNDGRRQIHTRHRHFVTYRCGNCGYIWKREE